MGLQWVMPISVRQQLVAWKGFFGKRVKFKAFRAIPHAIFWLLWMERNRRVFDGVETSIEQLKDKWLMALFFWKEDIICSSIDVIDFVDGLF